MTRFANHQGTAGSQCDRVQHVSEAGRFRFCGKRVRVTPEALFISQEFAATSLLPIELYGPQRPAETVLTRIEHREYRSLLGKLQWLQLESRPDLSYEENRAAQRSSAPTIAAARGLNAVAFKAQ